MQLYLIAFGVIVVLSAGLAIYAKHRLGGMVTVVIGVVLTIAAVVLFIVSKSDSVPDTFLEKLADFSPPLLTLSVVIGWWAGYFLSRFVRRLRGRA